MKIKKTVNGLTFSMLLMSTVLAAADFDKGLQAYQSGDYETALAEFEPLAIEGNPAAQYYAANLYFEGAGTSTNITRAIELYTMASSQDVADAQYALGYIYLNGASGVDVDQEEALKWFRMSAERGLIEGQYNLAKMYLSGIGGPVDYESALFWYHQAAEKGLLGAQNNLGLMYKEGLGVTADNETAIEWYLKAARQGDGFAQNNIGVIYANQSYKKFSYLKAYMWFSISENSSKSGLKNKENIALRLSKKQVAEAQRMKVSCLTSNFYNCFW